MQITHCNSPNFGSRCGWRPDIIVCHITDGAYDGAVAWLCNKASEISAHFVVSRTGQISQLVDIRQAAYCNGTQSGSPNGAQYVGRATAALVKQRRVNANLYTVSIEFEGNGSTHGILTSAQFAAGVDLIKYIRQQVKQIYGIDIPVDRNHIIGHCEVTPVEKPDCPGKDFPWSRLLASLSVLSVLVHIDAPVNNAVLSGTVTIGGWALSVARVDIYADIGTSHKQGLASIKPTGKRLDVAGAYPYCVDAVSSGYTVAVPAGKLSKGKHTIDVAGILPSGGVVWQHINIIVK